MKAILVKLEKPEDVLKIQDVLAQAFADDKVQDLHGIKCACGGRSCDKHIIVHRYASGLTVLAISRGADLLAGLTLDEDGRKRLVEQLGGTMGA